MPPLEGGHKKPCRVQGFAYEVKATTFYEVKDDIFYEVKATFFYEEKVLATSQGPPLRVFVIGESYGFCISFKSSKACVTVLTSFTVSCSFSLVSFTAVRFGWSMMYFITFWKVGLSKYFDSGLLTK